MDLLFYAEVPTPRLYFTEPYQANIVFVEVRILIKVNI